MKNSHSISIDAKVEKIFPEIVNWGQAKWWPKSCRMRFIKQDDGPVRLGTKFKMVVMIPGGPRWDAEIANIIENKSISRKFLNGMFAGSETLEIECLGDKSVVNYSMDYEVNGAINRFLWKLIGEKLHNRNLQLVLNALKRHCERSEAISEIASSSAFGRTPRNDM